MPNMQEIAILFLRTLFWLVLTIYAYLEAAVLALVPRKYLQKDVRGSVALVTGGGSGIGRLMCLKLAEKGAIVVTWDVDEKGNVETAKQVESIGGQCRAYKVDLCDRNAVYAAAAKVKQEVGKVDILINNAGVVTGKDLMDSPDDCIMRTFNVNVICHFWTTKAFLGDMIASNKGHIVTIASMAGKVTCSSLVDYCSSKFAAVGFHESLRTELKVMGKDGVKTTVVCPIMIKTGMFEGAETKFLPHLEPSWVAEEVIDAMLMNVNTLRLPFYMWVLEYLNLTLPSRSLEYFAYMMHWGSFMKNFVGRTKTN